MTISHIGSGAGGAFGFTAQAGDLIFFSQLFVNAATVPDEASGYTTLFTGTQGVSGHRFGYKIADGTETAPYATFPANTNSFSWSVYRSSLQGLAVGASALAKGTGTTASIPTITLQDAGNTSWVFVPVLSRTSTAAQMSGAVTGTTLRLNGTRVAVHHSTATVTAWTARTKAGMASEAWAAVSIEIKEISATYATGAGSSAGSASAAGVGQAIKAAAGAATGVAGGQAVGQAYLAPANQGAGNSAGSASVVGVGRSTVAGVGSSAGVATVKGGNVIAGVGSSSGIATASGKAVAPLPGPCRILLGNIPGGGYGVRISEPGYDAAANPVDDERLLFNSDWEETFPIYLRGSTTHRTTAQQGQIVVQTINFTSLGYVPHFDWYIKGNGDAFPAGSDIYPTTDYFDQDGISYVNMKLAINASQLRIESFVPQGAGDSSAGLPRTWTVYYTIYRRAAV